jgi:hypothetical protein
MGVGWRRPSWSMGFEYGIGTGDSSGLVVFDSASFPVTSTPAGLGVSLQKHSGWPVPFRAPMPQGLTAVQSRTMTLHAVW